MNILVNSYAGPVIVEIQLCLDSVLNQKQLAHLSYNYVRDRHNGHATSKLLWALRSTEFERDARGGSLGNRVA